jgi:hypothetical protein
LMLVEYEVRKRGAAGYGSGTSTALPVMLPVVPCHPRQLRQDPRETPNNSDRLIREANHIDQSTLSERAPASVIG